ncbi:hypothetical protein ElyMa_001924800 [Elysia marginata]|uniref:SRCR domain-containing protein n=1 Tax=Elysia marginata TaxID=1093978 RepID=A0AAV4EUH6_9GAST|nr:hypothetical protein ElyMa_001924800 [Elysia marginata]
MLVKSRSNRPTSDHRTIDAMRVTAGVTACGQRIPKCSTGTLKCQDAGTTQTLSNQVASGGCQDARKKDT